MEKDCVASTFQLENRQESTSKMCFYFKDNLARSMNSFIQKKNVTHTGF